MEIKKLSRFAVEQSMQCERCFVLQYKYKISLSSLPFTLNSAVDNLCKNEFDYYRANGKPHPIFLEHGIDAVPFNHPEMDNWRQNFKGAYFLNEDKGYKFGGAVDDIWIKPNGELIIADVKCTSKNVFDWESTYSKYDYAKGYQRQLEMYQWVFRSLGFPVTDEAYLVYFNGLKNEPMFDQQLKFELHVIKLDCSDAWVEDAIIHARSLLDMNDLPPQSSKCDKCNYLKKRWDLSLKMKESKCV
jgi:hypothetical protein